MAIRTTAAAVAAVMVDASSSPKGQGDYDGTTSLTPYMETASAMVDDVVICAAAKGKAPLTSARLELIERWLSCYCYCLSDKPYSNNSTAGASAAFQGQTGKYGEINYYGMMAMRLDPSGCLDSILGGERKVAAGAWLGKPKSEQIDYVDRD